MKITKEDLRKIIKEEIYKSKNEEHKGTDADYPGWSVIVKFNGNIPKKRFDYNEKYDDYNKFDNIVLKCSHYTESMDWQETKVIPGGFNIKVPTEKYAKGIIARLEKYASKYPFFESISDLL